MSKESLLEIIDEQVRREGIDAAKKFIDGIIDGGLLSFFEAKDVLDAATERGFMISRCMFCKRYTPFSHFKENREWMQGSEELNIYPKVSDGICPACFEERYGGVNKSK